MSVQTPRGPGGLGNVQLAYQAFEAAGLSELEDVHVLDLDCGTGEQTILRFFPYSGIAQITGVVGNRQLFDHAHALTGDPRFTWKIGPLESCELEPESYALALVPLDALVSHTPDPAVLAGLLKAGGALCALGTTAVPEQLEQTLEEAGFENICTNFTTRKPVAQRPATSTSLLLARKAGTDPVPWRGPLFSDAKSQFPLARSGSWRLAKMTEGDLAEVMEVEISSFPDPWTPVAYAMELRHNPRAHYVVCRNAEGALGGYLGWWDTGDSATIMHIAVAPEHRRQGVGTALIEYLRKRAALSKASTIELQVRAKNAGARSFYEAMGFSVKGVSRGYYTSPDDDALALALDLGEMAPSR